jgi:hypothetical protein
MESQWPLWQSPLTRHALPLAQPGQLPPQSTSVSSPFFTASLQVGTWQVPPLQTRLWHCKEMVQGWPLARLVVVQAPPRQTCPFAQACPQLPQLLLSLWVFTHCPLQAVKFALQLMPQLPFVQVAVPFCGTGQ